ncbi:MAG: ribose 5-phosphate isomerase B [Elusimicrobia bacterium RIFOXYC2_FULL_34_12]|nr:MAG: ribose 5-phosphate isomerase B [Elusimicrobia bacterium RIFOXYC2_FULL_34_12]OGS38427.1 MAG: ribose 5-phosphate isomerase B [Elusimicrobia bacterium RIFOXYD2_FULL_34_30]HAM38188.1 ribose 5-phosphate isomerase B [Elusimicrobiota bacterium]
MKIAIGSDHRGFRYKTELMKYLSINNIVKDFGTFSEESCDYPDFAYKVAKAVASGRYKRGILICGSGNGICIAANKVKGIRAALGYSEKAAEFAVRHNDANIICFSEDFSLKNIKKSVKKFLFAEFESGRHLKRVKKIKEIERGNKK